MIAITTQDEMRKMAFGFIPRKSAVVEVGCSFGNFAELIRNTEHHYIGVDIQSDKINEARHRFPEMNFVNCDITKNLYILKQADVIISLQCFEHIDKDLDVLRSIPWDSIVILSVPNRQYKGHVRWFELEGWTKRFSPYMNIIDMITIQHPTKSNNRSFLFRGIKNVKNN